MCVEKTVGRGKPAGKGVKKEHEHARLAGKSKEGEGEKSTTPNPG